MTPGRYDLKLYRGDSYSWRFVLYDDPARAVPTNLVGATVAAEYREESAGDAIVNFVCTITAPNIIDMRLPVGEWGDAAQNGVWDLEITFPNGRVHTPVAGTVTVTPDVTNSALFAEDPTP